MKRLLFAGAVALAMLGLSVQPAPAITGGVVDSNNVYSNVGAVVVIRPPTDRPDLEVPRVFATGALIHPRVYLTAGHATDPIAVRLHDGRLRLDDIRISFGVNAFDPRTWLEIEGVMTHPDYNPHGDPAGGPADLNDVGVLILKKPVRNLPLAVLPELGLLDFLKATGQLREASQGGTKFTVAGYGAQFNPSPPEIIPSDGLRRVAQSEYQALTDDWLYLSQNFATGDGGTGFGDSGGPTFWTAPDGTLLLVSITSRGDPVLVSNGVTWRIDIAESLDFIEFVLWLVD